MITIWDKFRMFRKTVNRSVLELRIASSSSSSLPPTFLLPSRSRYFNFTPHDGASYIYNATAKAARAKQTTPLSTQTIQPLNQSGRNPPTPPKQLSTALDVSESIKKLLPLLAMQSSHYISIHIHGKPYLVMAGDIVRLPFKMPGVLPGDILRLNRATAIGSRDYTMKGVPYLDERLFECRATVMGTESEPMRFKEKTKRRNRRVKTVKSKHQYTILRIAELKIKSLEDLVAS